jgi:uncharacterized protein YegP (UPF0339 family)
VKENAPQMERYISSVDKACKYRFKMIAANKQTIDTSEGYQTEVNMKGGIESVGRWAPDALLKEVHTTGSDEYQVDHWWGSTPRSL